MLSEKLAIVLLTMIVMAEAKVCYKYHRLVNGSFDCVNGTRNETTPCTSYRLGGVSLGQGTATGGALLNGNTSPSSSKQSQSVSTTDVSPSTTEIVETTDRNDRPSSSSPEATRHSTTDVSPSITEVAETASRLTPTNGNTPPSSSQEAQSHSNTDVPPSTSETIENAPRLTPTNGNTPPSSSQEAESHSTTDVPPSTSETIENAPRCNSLIVTGKNYSMAKNACGEIGGKMFGYEHVQSNEKAKETFRDLMSTYEQSSSCSYVWVDIIRNDEKQYKWSEGPDFGLQDSWWGNNQPYDFRNFGECVAGHQNDNWKLHDVLCTRVCCTMCMDAWCNSG